MKEGISPADLNGRRYAHAEWTRRLLNLGARCVVGVTPRRLLFPILWRASAPVSRAVEMAGFHMADALDPDLRPLALRELVRACRPHLGYAPFDFALENETAIRRLQQQGRGVLWCGLHHALNGVIVRVFELCDWPAAVLATQPKNPAWGGDDSAQSLQPGPAALLGVRQALRRGCAVAVMLDAGRQTPPVVTVQTHLLELARRTGAPVVAYRAEVDPRQPLIRIRTRLGPAADCGSEQFWPHARAAVEQLYGADWGLQLEWTTRRRKRSQPPTAEAASGAAGQSSAPGF